jgi:hypothetical protein|tara:strand:+ start:1081 stop:1269 length:189 start_codon:yes stop_codon:yes gene_type:complete
MPGKKLYNMEDKAMMMKPYEMGHSPEKMGHSPKEMKHSSMPMKGHGKATKAGRPAILKHMSS